MAKLKLASEMINYQDRSFGNKISYAFQQALDVVNELPNIKPSGILEEVQKKSTIKLDEYLEKTIKDRTNLSVKVRLYSGMPGAIMVFPFNRHNVLLKERVRGSYYLKDEKKILTESLGSKGTVDLKEGRVEGIFETYVHTLYLDLNILFKVYRLTADEATAIVLHELGHAFTYYEYSNRLSNTNQLLAQLANDIHNGDDKPEERTYIFKELANHLHLSEKEVSELYNSTDNLILGGNIFKLYIKEIKSLRQNTKYDETNSESLADNFAVRQGYAKPLVTGLDKLYTYTEYKNDFVYATVLTTDIFYNIIYTPAIIVAMFMNSPVLGSFFLLLFIGTFILGGDLSFKDMTYDVLKQRYTRIRQGLVGALKNDDLDKEQVAEILNGLDEIDDVIRDTRDYMTIKEKVMRVISPFSRGIAKDMSHQQMLEELGNNDLFIESARLKNSL
jgi:hypothetical protein